MDAAGRHIILPDHVSRVLPAERNAEVMVFVLAPEKLVGTSRGPGRGPLPSGGHAVLGWRARSDPATLATTALQLRADLIIDAGTATPERAAFADQVMQQTGIPYILVDDSFARMPRSMRAVGAVIGADAGHVRDVWRYAERAIAALHGGLLIVPPSKRPRVYYARGSDGLTTALPGSPAGAAIAEAGAINVTAPLGRDNEVRLTPAQLLAFDPEIIIADGPSAYNAMRHNRLWRGLLAVRNRRVYLEPTYPFGWIEDPSGVNRVIGLYWLSNLFYPETLQDDIRGTTCEFYDKFYRIRLTNAQLERMLRAAGIPPAEAAQPPGEPLPGLGGTPPSLAVPAVPAIPAPGGATATPPLSPTPANATCTLPGSTSGPLNLTTPAAGNAPGVAPGSPPAGLGVPPPGRRGRPGARLEGAPAPSDQTAAAANAIPTQRDGPAYQYQTRP